MPSHFVTLILVLARHPSLSVLLVVAALNSRPEPHMPILCLVIHGAVLTIIGSEQEGDGLTTK